MAHKRKPAPDLSWVTDEVVVRMNYVRYRANMPDLTKEEWLKVMPFWSQIELNGTRWYCSTAR
jgi:hypothetical protein